MNFFASLTDVYAPLRAACPAIERMCGRIFKVTIDGDRVIHEDNGCSRVVGVGSEHRAPLSVLFHKRRCDLCAIELDEQVFLYCDTVDHFQDLFAGPALARRPAADLHILVVSNALQFLEIVAEVEDCLDFVDGQDQVELRELYVTSRRRWEEWFVAQGRRDLDILTRLGGRGAWAGEQGLRPDPHRMPNVTTARASALSEAAMRALAASMLGGDADPVGVATVRVLDDEDLFFDRPVNAATSRVAALAATGMDLFDVIDVVRREERQRETEAVLRHIVAQTLPVGAGGDAWVVVSASKLRWSSMFWSPALWCCFPSAATDDAVAVAVPKAIGDRVSLSLPPNDTSDAAVSLPMSESDACELVPTVAALLSDGLVPVRALSTAIAVMS